MIGVDSFSEGGQRETFSSTSNKNLCTITVSAIATQSLLMSRENT